MRRVRIAIALAACALIVWLVIGTSSRGHWSSRTFVNKVTRELDEQEAQSLATLFGSLLTAAKVREEFAVNEPADSQKISFFVTASAAAQETGCRPGNARYVPRDDVILVEESLVWPKAALVQYSTVSLQGRGTRSVADESWLSFAVLHELAHRQLRHGGRSDLSAEDFLELEREADDYAFDALRLLASAERNGNSGRSTLVLTNESLRGHDEEAIGFVASIIQQLSVSFLFNASQFSPYYADSSHAAFADRFGPQLLKLMGEARSREAKVAVLLAMEYLERVRRAGERVVAEAFSSIPIAAVEVHDGAVVVEFEPIDGNSPARTEVIQTDGLGDAGGVRQLVIGSESAADGGISSQTPPGLESASSATEPKVVVDYSAPDLVWRVDAGPGSSIVERLVADILSDFRAAYAPYEGLLPASAECEARPGAVQNGTVDLFIMCSGNRAFLGTLQRGSLELVEVEEAAAPERAQGDAWTVVDYRADGTRSTLIVIVSLADVHKEPFQIAVWEIGVGRPTRLLATQELVMEWLPLGSQLRNWLRISHPPVVSCRPVGAKRVACVEYLDSVFLFDANSRSLEVLFYPAGVQAQYGKELAVFYVKGGHKIYLSKLTGGERTPRKGAARYELD